MVHVWQFEEGHHVTSDPVSLHDFATVESVMKTILIGWFHGWY